MIDNQKRKTADDITMEKKQYERKEELIQRMFPHRNHTVYEFNKVTQEIKEAVFYNIPTIKWEDAVMENYTKYRKVKQNENCIYISALNVKNAKKVLQRDHNIKFNLEWIN